MSAPAAAVIGLPGPRLDTQDRARLAALDPLGVILFARNVEAPSQLQTLCRDIRDALGRSDAPILIDQEGGRVARLKPPHWPERSAAAPIGAAFVRDPEAGRRAAWLHGRLIAHDVTGVGVDVVCAPVADVRDPDGHDVIGDRAYADDPSIVIACAGAASDGIIAGGAVPVVKHAPGHGRARADSHEETPVVDASLAELETRDFAPFRALVGAPWMMTAHVVYEALNPSHVATLSRRILHDMIREEWGYEGVIVSDDLAMKALQASPESAAAQARAAGCDLVLWCAPDWDRAGDVCRGAGPIGIEGADRLRRARPVAAEPFDPEAGAAEFARLLGGSA